MREVKTVNLNLDTYGNYLGMEKGCIILRDRQRREKRYPLFEQEIGEVILKSGNMVSTGVLSALGFWGIDVLVSTRNDRPIAILKNLEDDSHVKTRINQYEAIKNGKGILVAKRIVLAKAMGQNQVLTKYGLMQHDTMKDQRNYRERVWRLGIYQEKANPDRKLVQQKLLWRNLPAISPVNKTREKAELSRL